MSLLTETDIPPAYGDEQVEEFFAPPTYSPASRCSDSSLRTTLDDSLWKYESRHITVNLGPRLWDSDTPAYGLNAKVEGIIRIYGSLEHVVEVSALLEGALDLSLPEIGVPSTHDVIFLSRLVNFTPAEIQECSRNQNELSFSIPIPSQVEFQGVTSRTPPTYIRYYYGLVCTIKYYLKVWVVRHGALKSVDTRTVPIYYLPKSRPPQPPLASVPRPSIFHDEIHTPNFHESDRVRTYQLKSVNTKGNQIESNTMFFSLPSPHCFTSGCKIPFLLGFIFPSDPALGELYFNKIHITLLKRLTICPIGTSLLKRLLTRSSSKPRRDPSERRRSPEGGTRDSPSKPGNEEPVIREWQINTGHVKFRSEYAEGVCLYRGFIKTGDAGRECSWILGSAIKVQYLLRVSVASPDHMEDHLPDFELELPIDLATDTWEVADRETRSMGGIPVPALGLMKSLDSDSII